MPKCIGESFEKSLNRLFESLNQSPKSDYGSDCLLSRVEDNGSCALSEVGEQTDLLNKNGPAEEIFNDYYVNLTKHPAEAYPTDL